MSESCLEWNGHVQFRPINMPARMSGRLRRPLVLCTSFIFNKFPFVADQNKLIKKSDCFMLSVLKKIKGGQGLDWDMAFNKANSRKEIHVVDAK